MDCGEDGHLYMHTNHGKPKHEGTIQDYVKKTPLYEGDKVTVGSMHSTVFKVDLGTGRLIYKYGKSFSSDFPNGGTDALSAEGRKEVESSDAQLYIERIDYSLSTEAFDIVLWDLTIGFFKAKVHCKMTGHLLDEASLDLNSELVSRSDTHRIVSSPWEFEIPVFQIRTQGTVDCLRQDGITDPGNTRESVEFAPSIGTLEEGQNTERAIKARAYQDPLVQIDKDGRTIGRLFIFNQEIAKGSNGTVVYEGAFDGRKVAVKRMVRAYQDVALKEIENLISSDQHPNVVRWYGVEKDPDFVYLALEHCSCNLNDLIESLVDSSQNFETSDNISIGTITEHNSETSDNISIGTITEHKARLSSVKAIMQDINLWKSNGHPSALLFKLMRDVVYGLVHLHDLGIIHRDLKPQNVLINKKKTLCAKLSDMGISKRLPADRSSLGHNATGKGSSGWQAPEQLDCGRETRAIDMFSLGCVLFFCVTQGKHPFGERYDRDCNIIKNNVDLFLVEKMPEALELFTSLLQHDPCLRLTALEVLYDPFFWNSEMRLSFLRDASDRFERESRDSTTVQALESVARVTFGARWDKKMDPDFINIIGQHRHYNHKLARDLLRVLRNLLNHYQELSADIQALLGPVPNGFDEYFTSKFPSLLIEVYKVVYKHCKTEEWFQKYLQGGAN